MPAPVPFLSPQRTLLELRLRQRTSATTKIRPDPRGLEPRPLSFGQMRMWFLWRLEPETPVYNGSLRLRLKGKLNVPALERAVNEIGRRHDVLRAHFPSPEGQPVQVVRAWEFQPMPCVNLERVEPAARTAELELLTRRVVLEPYDLETGPVTRRMLARMSSQEHVLILAFHHIVFDAWSRQVAQRELEQLYSAFARGKASPLSELPIQYADFSRWQREQSETPRYRNAFDHWLQHLAGELPVLTLPMARPRPAHRTYEGAEVQVLLPGKLISALTALAQQEGATLFVVLLAALKTLLHRYSGLEDLIVGSPVAGRTLVETEPLMGCLVNTLAIRSRVESSMPYRALLRAERQAVLAGFEHQFAPFEQVVEKLSPVRASNRTPIFQAALNFKNVPSCSSRWENLEATRWDFEAGIAQFDLAIGLEEKDGGLDAACRFSTELFDIACMRRFMSHWLVLLAGIAERPDARLFELPLLTEGERRQLLVEWNQTARPYPREKCVHELFEEQARERPNAAAVCIRDVTWSYGELDCSAEKVAARLQSLGVAPDRLVGLCVERSPEMVAAMLGILKAGGAYLPLDAALPDERLALQLTAARPTALIAQSKNLERLRLLAAHTAGGSEQPSTAIIAIEELMASSSEAEKRTRPPVRPEHLAYVMYTSGSTGKPKGVMVPHRGVVRLVKSADYASLSAEETLLHLAPLSFDASTFEIWGALLNGGRLALMAPGQPTPAEIGEAIHRHGVTTLWLTAALFHLMVEERLADLQPLRQLLTGGDVLSPRHVARARHGLPGCRLINGYGPTENTTFTCCHTISRDEDGSRPIPIGRPVANTRLYVLDRHFQPVPVGVPGELCAAGDGVARGYLADSAGTAERFMLDPFSTTPGACMYRTGDLVSYSSDGTLNFLGRSDRQVKIRGFRVEPEEIEAALLDCPGITEAAVVVREISGERQLVGYVAAESAPERPTEFWRDYLRRRLPDCMVPLAFVKLDRLPHSPNGKIDRAALPPLVSAEGRSDETVANPVNLLELELLRIWQRLFDRSDIGRQDNFFDVGGHSLMAARLASQVERLLGHRMPLASLFQASTVESLARMLREEDWLPPWTSLVPLQPLGSKPPFFFVHGWGGDVFRFVSLARRLAPEQPVYGLQAVGLDGRRPRHTSVEEMAAHYVKEIRSFQSAGPYYVGGYSMGGWVAWEVAQELRRHGQPVAMVALVDTQATSRLPLRLGLPMVYAQILRRCFFHLRRCAHVPILEWRNYFGGRMESLRFHLSRILSTTPPSAFPPAAAVRPGTGSLGDYYVELGFRYRPSPYDGAVDLFQCEDASPHGLIAFQRLALGGVRLHSVAGSHLTMMDEDHVSGFAISFHQALDAAQQRAPANQDS